MKNIILQHWEGELSDLCKASNANIAKYASKVGAEYRLLRGILFRKNLPLPCQKLYMLDKEFDEYDLVVMLDTDMFVRSGVEENIFEVPGVGMHTFFQTHLFKSFGKKFPQFYNSRYPFWGGAIYKTTPELRQRLRVCFQEEEMNTLGNSAFLDEAIMHRLATLAKYNDNPYLPGEFKWCHCSYREGIERASFIHIRTKINSKSNSPKQPKLENYKLLVKRKLIEE